MSSKFLDKTGLDTLWAKIKSTFQTLGNLVTAWGSTPSDTKYPSEKLVKTALDGKVPTSRTVNGKALSSNITLNASDVGSLPGHYIWSGGINAVYGYKIGESTTITSNAVYSIAMGTIACTNKYVTEPQTGRDGALVMGFFYIWFYKSNGSWKGRMRLFSCNPSLSNDDIKLFHYVNGNKVEFFLGFQQNGSPGTLTTKRAVGVGISYIYAQNFSVPASLEEVPQNQPYTDYWSLFKNPYYGQIKKGVGSAFKPVYINEEGSVNECTYAISTSTTGTDKNTIYLV